MIFGKLFGKAKKKAEAKHGDWTGMGDVLGPIGLTIGGDVKQVEMPPVVRVDETIEQS